MANEFIIKNGFHSKGDSQITGSLNVKDSLTVNGSAVGAAFPFTGDAQLSGSLLVSGSINVQTGSLVVNDQISSSFINIGKKQGVVLGIGAVNNRTTDITNVIIGNTADGGNTNSYDNISIGRASTIDTSNGAGAISIGVSGQGGNNSVNVGYYSKASYNDVSIGRQAGSKTNSNKINIGREAQGTGNQSITFNAYGDSVTPSEDNTFNMYLKTNQPVLTIRQTGSSLLTGSSFTVEKSGSTVFSVIGSEGDLFTITDSLTSGSLFAVKDISGFPLLDVTKKHDGTPDLVTVGQSDLKLDSGSISVTGSINVSLGSISVPNHSAPSSGSFLATGSAVCDLVSKTSEFAAVYSVRSPAGGQYQIEGPGLSGEENKPALYLTRGQKYRFQINAVNHPFYIQTTDNGGAYDSGNVYNDGVTGNGTQETGSVDFNVQFDAPTTLYYRCSQHSGMGNTIYIEDANRHSGSFSGSFTGDGTNLDLASNTTIPASNPFPISASSAQIISRSFASGHTDSTALRLLGSGSVSESGIFEVKGSVGPLFSVADGLDGILMEVNDISGLPLLQVSSSGIVRTPVGITSQRPIITFGTNFTASSAYEGYYFRVGGEITCSIQTGSLPTVNAEFDFFQTSSAGNLLFETGSTDIIVNSKNDNLNLAGQFSSATLKYIGNNTFDLMGDLT